MGYLFLAISLFAGATKGYCGKQISTYTRDLRSAVLANTVRMLLCAAIGLGLLLLTEGVGALAPSRALLLCALLSGVATSAFVVTWLLSVRRAAYMMLDVFLTSGLIVPLLFCLFLFDEQISLRQWAGLCVLLIAVLILCSYQSTVRAKITGGALALFLLCGLSSGVCDLSQKLFVRTAPDASIAAFSLYTYLFSALILGVVLLVLSRQAQARAPEARVRLPRAFYLYIGVMAVCLFCNSYFKTAAASQLRAALLYPLSQGGALILSTLMATFLFRERMNRRGAFGIALCFAALLMINL